MAYEQAVHESVACRQCRWVRKQVQVELCLQEVRRKGRRWIQAIKTFSMAPLRPRGLELELRTGSILVNTGILHSWVAWDASVQLPLKNHSSLFCCVGHSGQKCWSWCFLEISLCK